MNVDQVTYYSSRAKEYENIYYKPERQNDIPKVISYLQKHFKNKVLIEIACGTGYWTQKVSKTAMHILATDINKSVIDIAKSKYYEANNVEFQLVDIFNLPNNLGQFEAGFGGFIWSHIPKHKLRVFLKNYLSLIKPEGLAIFLDNNYVEGSSTLIYKTDKAGNTYQKRILQDGSEHSIIKNFPSDEEILSYVTPVSKDFEITRFDYFWAVKFYKK